MNRILLTSFQAASVGVGGLTLGGGEYSSLILSTNVSNNADFRTSIVLKLIPVSLSVSELLFALFKSSKFSAT